MGGSRFNGEGATVRWGEFARGWRAFLVAGGKSPATIRVYGDVLRWCACWCRERQLEPADVTREHLVEWLGGQSWSASTRQLVRTALGSAWRWGVSVGALERDVTVGLPAVRRRPPSPHPTPEHAYASALRAAAPRERLMLRLAAEAGLRRAEVAVVHRRDLVDGADGWSLWVHGKGGRDRLVPLNASLARELRIRCGEGWAFPGARGSHLSVGHVGALISRVLPPGYSMHSLRHRFATEAHTRSGGALLVVQELLGHASPATTRMYVLTDQRVKREVVALVEAGGGPSTAPPPPPAVGGGGALELLG